MMVSIKLKKKKREKKKEEKSNNKSTTNFQPTIQKMPTKPTSSLAMINQTTEEKIKSPPQSKFITHQEEDQTFNSVELNH